MEYTKRIGGRQKGTPDKAPRKKNQPVRSPESQETKIARLVSVAMQRGVIEGAKQIDGRLLALLLENGCMQNAAGGKSRFAGGRDDVEELQQEIECYLETSLRMSLPVSLSALWAYLGISHATAIMWEREGGARADLLQSAKTIIAACTIGSAQMSEIHPVVGIFTLKAAHGWDDGSRQVNVRVDTSVRVNQHVDVEDLQRAMDALKNNAIESTIAEE